MKITKKHDFKTRLTEQLNFIKSFSLNQNITITNQNFYTTCLYINYKTFKINQKYKELLPTKINDLKAVKHRILGLKVLYQRFILEYQNNVKNGYNPYLIYTNIKEHYNDVFNLLKELNIITEHDETQNKDYSFYEKRLITITEFLKEIDLKIKDYQNDLNHKKEFKISPINNYDLIVLKSYLEHKTKFTTFNLNRFFYFWIMALKKCSQASIRTRNALNDTEIFNALNDYCDDVKSISHDFKHIVKNDITTFETWFLTKIL